jgi:hypothetical protein
MIVYRELLESGGYIEHVLLDTMSEGANYIEIDKTPTPEEIAELNNIKLQELKNKQYQELLETDWYVTRYIETGIPIPENILQIRQEIRNKY